MTIREVLFKETNDKLKKKKALNRLSFQSKWSCKGVNRSRLKK